ncbi:MAG: peptidase C45 [Streptomycetaceae bacterium]|nr:peptidase C45 [Streptomycetaceae bacterium]
MSVNKSVAFIRASGDPYTIGLTHGAALADALRSFLDDSLCRLNKVMPEPVTLGGLLPSIADYRSVIAAALPELADEVAGLAAGAGISEDEAWLLQLRREIMGYRKVPTSGDCTTYARAHTAGPVLAQTVDLNGDLDEFISVLEIARSGTERRALVLSFGGLLGYLGVNSDGLAIGLNLVLGGEWRPGVPPYLAIRHLLDTAENVEQALEILAGLRLASSRSLTLCDRKRAVCVEVLGEATRVFEGSETVHTNHFLHPDFGPADEINVFARNSSVRRLRTAAEGLAGLGPLADPEEHFALLSQPPICVPDRGDIRAERTVAAVVLLPVEGRMHLRPGDPSRSRTQVFPL